MACPFSTALSGIVLTVLGLLENKMFSKGTTDFKKIEAMFSQLQEQYDMLAASVKQHREEPTGIEVRNCPCIDPLLADLWERSLNQVC